MKADLATELSAEVESLKRFVTQTRQRIRRIARRAGIIIDRDKFNPNPNGVTRLVNVLNDILTLPFSDLLSASTSEVQDAICCGLDPSGDREVESEIDVKQEEFCSSSRPSQEDTDDFDPFDLSFNPNEEEDLECVIRPVLDLKTSLLSTETPGSRVNNKNRETIVLTKTNKLPRNVDCDGSKENDKHIGSGEGQGQATSRGKRELRLVLDRLSKKVLAKWKVPVGRKCKLAAKLVLQQGLGDDSDDADDNRTDRDDEYILPNCNASSEEDDVEFVPSHKQAVDPAPKGKRKIRPVKEVKQFEIFDPVTHAKRYRCPDCSKVIKQATSFRDHLRIHTGEKPFICPICGVAFRRKDTLRLHSLSLHPTEKNEFFCDECPKSFQARYVMMMHRRRRHAKKKEPAEGGLDDVPSRKRTPVSQQHIQKRKRYYQNVTAPRRKLLSPVACPDCGLISKHAIALKYHQKLCHSSETSLPRRAPVWPCPLCELKFGMKLSLRTHLVTVHDSVESIAGINSWGTFEDKNPVTGIKRLRCPQCEQMISCINFRNHTRLHTGERPHLCPTCGITFRDKASLKNHCKRRHPPEGEEKREFFCDKCPKSFRFQNDLQSHQRRMHPEGERLTFLCAKCPKQFTLKNFLNEHMLAVHEQARRFKCKLCDKAFKWRGNLRYHEEVHANPGAKKRRVRVLRTVPTETPPSNYLSTPEESLASREEEPGFE